MKDIAYNGFTGSIHFSEVDNLFYGKIEGITDLVTFEAQSLLELMDAFRDMVDELIKDCEVENIEQRKRLCDGRIL